MKCIECGHELKDGAVYCIRCGAMQISMDGTRLEGKQEWPEVEPQSDTSNWRPSVDQGAAGGAGARHTKEFNMDNGGGNGRRIAAIVIGLILAAAIIAIMAFSCMGPATSGSDDSSEAANTTTSTESASSEASSDETSSESASSTATSSKSASSAAASSSAAAASSESAATREPAPTIVEEPQPQPQPQVQTYAVGDEPSYAPAPSVGDYVLGDSSSRYYSRSELEGMSTSDLYYARNEIFARHGRMFHRSDLQAYFNSKSWYTPIYTPEQWDAMGNQLSDVELQNSDLMRDVEASKGSPYL